MAVFLCSALHYVSSYYDYIIPPVTVVSSASTITVAITIALPYMRLAAALSQHDVVLPATTDPMGYNKGWVSLTIMLQEQPQSQMPSQVYASYAMDPHQMRLLFQS